MLHGHLFGTRLDRVLRGPTERRVFNRSIIVVVAEAVVAAIARGCRSQNFAHARMHDLQVCVVQQRLEIRARETLRGVCEVIKVDVGRHGDLSCVGP